MSTNLKRAVYTGLAFAILGCTFILFGFLFSGEKSNNDDRKSSPGEAYALLINGQDRKLITRKTYHVILEGALSPNGYTIIAPPGYWIKLKGRSEAMEIENAVGRKDFIPEHIDPTLKLFPDEAHPQNNRYLKLKTVSGHKGWIDFSLVKKTKKS